MPDLLRVESNERVDLGDFQFLAGDCVDAMGRVVSANFLTSPTGQRAWIVSGFAITNPTAKQLQVTRGVAILARRDGAQIHHGMITAEGDALKIIDLNSYASATYGVYVRFEYVDGASASRIFWDASGAGTEFAQVINTRQQANWSVRVEQSDPGGEWFKIGEVVQSSMAITDERDFYFEGKVDDSYAFTWGDGANDRDADRAEYGVQDLRTFTDAVRRRLHELSGGDGWYSKNLDSTGIVKKQDMDDFWVDEAWISGYAVSIDSGLDVDITAGVAYVNGKRIAVDAASLTLTDNASRFVVLQDDGVIADAASQTAGTLTLASYTTASGSITVLTDARSFSPRTLSGDIYASGNIIPDTDGSIDLGTSSLYWQTGYLETVQLGTGVTITRSGSEMWLASGGTTKLTIGLDLEAAVDFVPSSGALTLGSSSTNWNRLFVDQILTKDGQNDLGASTGGIALDSGGTTGRFMSAYGGSSINHPFTSLADADTIGGMRMITSSGGLGIEGFTTFTTAVDVKGYCSAPDTSGNTSSAGVFNVYAYDDSGTGVQNCAAAANIVAFTNNATAAQLFKGNGDIFTNIALTGTVFDDEQDALACRDLSYAMAGQWDKVLSYHKDRLEELGIMENDFLSDHKFKGLVLGAIGEMYAIMDKTLKELTGKSYEDLRLAIRA